MSTATEVYAGDGDLITLYHLTDGGIDYAAGYYGTEGAREAAQDFAGITVQGIDPVDAGWELGGFEDLDQARERFDAEMIGDLVASSELYGGADLDMLTETDPEGCPTLTGRAFVREFVGEER